MGLEWERIYRTYNEVVDRAANDAASDAYQERCRQADERRKKAKLSEWEQRLAATRRVIAMSPYEYVRLRGETPVSQKEAAMLRDGGERALEFVRGEIKRLVPEIGVVPTDRCTISVCEGGKPHGLVKENLFVQDETLREFGLALVAQLEADRERRKREWQAKGKKSSRACSGRASRGR